MFKDPTISAIEGAQRVMEGTYEDYLKPTEAGPRAVAVATILTRQDVAGIFSLLMASHQQQVSISRGVWLIAISVTVWVSHALGWWGGAVP